LLRREYPGCCEDIAGWAASRRYCNNIQLSNSYLRPRQGEKVLGSETSLIESAIEDVGRDSVYGNGVKAMEARERTTAVAEVSSYLGSSSE